MISRLLIVGYGSIGRRHLKIARMSLPYADIRILRQQFTGEIPEFSNGCFSNLGDVLSFNPQVAIIANPAPHHLPIATELTKIGCHLLVEKPLSNNLYGVDELLKQVNEHQTFLQIGYNLRYDASLIEFRKKILDGLVGDILSVRCEVGQYLPSWRLNADYRKTVSAQKVLGGGVLLELSHELDYLRWIFGEVEWVSSWLNYTSTFEIDVEDTAHIILRFIMNSGRALTVNLNMDFIRQDATRQCTVIGERGSLRWNGLTGEVDLYQSNSQSWRNIFYRPHERDESYSFQWKSFLRGIETGSNSLLTVGDGKAVLQIIDAIRKSSMNDSHRVFISEI